MVLFKPQSDKHSSNSPISCNVNFEPKFLEDSTCFVDPHFSSIHPSIFFRLSGAGLRGQLPEQGHPDFPHLPHQYPFNNHQFWAVSSPELLAVMSKSSNHTHFIQEMQIFFVHQIILINIILSSIRKPKSMKQYGG